MSRQQEAVKSEEMSHVSDDPAEKRMTISERRGLLRPELGSLLPRDPIFSTAKAGQSSTTIPVNDSDPCAGKTQQADEELVAVLQPEMELPTPKLDTIPRSLLTPGANKYDLWLESFGFTSGPLTPSSGPYSKSDFKEAVQQELATLQFLSDGLSKYRAVINSEEHTTFRADFLDKQNRATHVALLQLETVRQHLLEALVGIETMTNTADNRVCEDLVEIYCHAKPWIERLRAILIHSHAYYKINYCLAADREKVKTEGLAPEDLK